MYGDSGESYRKRDVEFVQSHIGKNARINRIRMLITDASLSNPAVKNVVIQILYSSIQTLKFFNTPQDKCRQVQLDWLQKLIKYAGISIDPNVQGVLDIINSVK